MTKDKKELHVYIDKDLYLFLREYAKQYIDMGYKNWLGKAVEDAIGALKEKLYNNIFSDRDAQHAKSKRGKLVSKVEQAILAKAFLYSEPNKRVRNKVLYIYNQIKDNKAIRLKDLIDIIIKNAGSDYRTIAKYLNILQKFFGIRFHAKNECIIYVQPDEEVEVKMINFYELPPVQRRELFRKCMK